MESTPSTLISLLSFLVILKSAACRDQGVVLRITDTYREKKATLNTGTVAVRYQGQWGTICDQHWDIHDATVACKQMGYTGALRTGVYGVGNKNILLDEVNCTGSETKLEDCKHKPWGSPNCQIQKAAGVACGPHKVLDGVFDVRLYRGHVGPVEIGHAGMWGTLCADSWDIKTGNVICRQLGFSGAEKAYNLSSFTYSSIILDELLCNGTENLIRNCKRGAWRANKCSNNTVAAVKCKLETKTQQQFAIRLTGGGVNYGTVEVYRYGHWGTICDDGWDKKDAGVVCRQLGYDYAYEAPIESRFGQGTGNIMLSEINCTGHEMSLEKCARVYDWGQAKYCQSYEAAGVVCGQLKVQTVDICSRRTLTLGTRAFITSPNYPKAFPYMGKTVCKCEAKSFKPMTIATYVHDRAFQENYRERLTFKWGRPSSNATRTRRVHGDTASYGLGPLTHRARSFSVSFEAFGAAGDGKFRIEYKGQEPITVYCQQISPVVKVPKPTPWVPPIDKPAKLGKDIDGPVDMGPNIEKVIEVSQAEINKLIIFSFFGGGFGMGMIILAVVLTCYMSKKKSCYWRKGCLEKNAYSVDVEESSSSDSDMKDDTPNPLDDSTSDDFNKSTGICFTNGRKRGRRVTFVSETPPSEKRDMMSFVEAYESYLDRKSEHAHAYTNSVCEQCENLTPVPATEFPETDL